MTDWTSGYVADINYTYGYYHELSPQRLKLPFLNAGLPVPEVDTACELGFGQGLSVNIHAAASLTRWHGTDFNPAQAGFAQEMAAVSGAGARLFDDAFLDFFAREDLPDFDFIGLHGIWTWISDENRAGIVDFVRRKLRVGGVLYISYNTMPGWAPMVPIRALLAHHAEVMGAPGQGILARADAALSFTERLLETKPAYARLSPVIQERLKKIKELNRNYVAHEYFTRDWHPMSFADMARWLSPAKLSYACSAHLLDHVDELNLSAEQMAFLKEVPDPHFRETVRDFMVGQQFRRDYWVKGLRPLSPPEKVERSRALRVVLVTDPADITLKVSGAAGEANLNEGVYRPIIAFLGDLKPHTLGQVEQALKDAGVSFAQVAQAVLVLAGKGDLAIAQDEKVTSKARAHTDRLNTYLLNRARATGEVSYLASPVTGGAVALGRFAQLFLIALSQGKRQPADLAAFVWQLLAAQGQRIVKEGRTLESPEEHLAELTTQAQQLLERRLAVLKALGVAP